MNPPGFPTPLDGVANPIVQHHQEPHLSLREQFLKHFVGFKSQVHVVGVGANEDGVVVDNQVDGLLPFGVNFGIGQGGRLFCCRLTLRQSV